MTVSVQVSVQERMVITIPRQARKISSSGYMHIIVRGIGKQILFEDRSDFTFFISALKRFSSQSDVSICAYCLMENHVHILILDNNRNVSVFMKKIGVAYSKYFNSKYDRTGHLFQDRYLSEAIEDERSLLIVFRYILKNPQKAGICPAHLYEWSSYDAYGKHNTFVNVSPFQELLGDRNNYIAFIADDDNDKCMEFEPIKKDDEWAKNIIRIQLGIDSGTVLQSYGREERNKALRKLKEAGLTIRQIERLTGINRGVVQKS